MTGAQIPGMDLSDPEQLPQILAMEEDARKSVIRMARDNSAVLAHHVLRHEQTNEPVGITDTQLEWHELMDAERRLLVWSHIEAGKAIPLDTPIPTPEGWTTMGALHPGALVFSSAGVPCRVVACSAIQHDRQLYEVEFSDGVVERADADHNWLAWSVDDRASGRAPRVVTTAAMLAHMRRGPNWFWTIPVAAPVAYPERDLPIHPYVLGAWLGDGDSDGPSFTCHEDDRAVVDRCAALEGGRMSVTRDLRGSGKVLRCRIGSGHDAKGPRDGSKLRTRLRLLGLLGAKHIPAGYLTASLDQRRELLAGLLDTDGSIDARGGKSCIELTLTDARLAADAVELVRSLGYKARIAESAAKLRGKEVGRRFRITFTARDPVFHLPRKLSKQKLGAGSTATQKRTVVGIRPIASVPVRCITVDSPDRSYLMGRSYTVTHNTQHFSIARVLWEIGHDPSVRCVILTATSQLAVKIARAVRTYIESSTAYREVFPHVLPALPWTDSYFNVRRKGHMKDFTVQATGAQGKILGARIDRLFMDDVLNLDNTKTTEAMLQMIKWFLSEFVGRLSKTSKVFAVGNAYNPHDLYHYLQKKSRYTARKYPVLMPNGEPRFPAEWSHERIAQKREELGPEEAARQLDCVPRDDSSTRCPQAWLDRALSNGLDNGLVYSASLLGKLPEGALIVSSMDLGVKANKKSGKTSIATVLYLPPTPEAKHGSRRLLDLASGKWTAKEMLSRMRDVHLRYGSVIFVEDNAAQDLLVQIAQDEQDLSDLVVRPFNTGGNKSDPVYGVESIFGEFGKSMWALPSTVASHAPMAAPSPANEAIAELVGECFFYSPTAHTGDHLMSVWINREGWRRLSGYGYQSNVTDVNVVGPSPAPDFEPGSADYEAAAQAEAERKRELEDWAPAIRRR